ncbi:hypothetical protein CW304_24270 [Bacillus sp. UFRGS-B20]|nr:hypothetical protein CW304_24270 [Bacillus sp. UFRGS-B20]
MTNCPCYTYPYERITSVGFCTSLMTFEHRREVVTLRPDRSKQQLLCLFFPLLNSLLQVLLSISYPCLITLREYV